MRRCEIGCDAIGRYAVRCLWQVRQGTWRMSARDWSKKSARTAGNIYLRYEMARLEHATRHDKKRRRDGNLYMIDMIRVQHDNGIWYRNISQQTECGIRCQ